ncbi:RBBP9/YdeN family alpha/beta hydrolase [Sphingoaurantiacus capsulatus]|uniref:RBBP9/YdeN family alpha/beta hydrolase n=1 Tax=Sphingoaurantiacus capsulatus TaxID=1771310 RepID=A0ABV7X9B1_9SPHN
MIATPATALIIPGIDGSGPDHWQTRWEAERGDCRRVDQRDWAEAEPDEWTGSLYRAVRGAPGDVVLVAHSLGCLLVDYATALFGQWQGRIRGALLVAPCDPERPGVREAIGRFPAARTPLPFRTIVVASEDDGYVSLDRARCFAERWGASFVEAGKLGHINAASDLGSWGFGQVLLDGLLGGSNATAVARAAELRAQRMTDDAWFGCRPN